MKIYALVDWMATSFDSVDDEYNNIKKELIKILNYDKFIYKTDIWPHQLKNDPVDVYIIDFGGVLPGCEDSIKSHFRELVNQIQEKPNTLFVIYSQMTENWYKEAIEDHAPEFKFPNVVMGFTEDYSSKLFLWLEEKLLKRIKNK